MGKKEVRFERIYKQNTSISGVMEIFVDYATGVQYLYHADGYGGGLAPLLGPDGAPLLYRAPLDE